MIWVFAASLTAVLEVKQSLDDNGCIKLKALKNKGGEKLKILDRIFHQTSMQPASVELFSPWVLHLNCSANATAK